jgi:hypothetical protein
MSRDFFQSQGRSAARPGNGVIGNPGKHVGEPNLRINIIELGGLDQGTLDCGAPTASLRSRRRAIQLFTQHQTPPLALPKDIRFLERDSQLSCPTSPPLPRQRVGLANIAYNMRRLVRLNGRRACV